MQEWTTTTTKETGIDLGDLWLFRWMPRVQTTMTQKAMANKAAQTGLGRNARQILPPAGVYTPTPKFSIQLNHNTKIGIIVDTTKPPPFF
jgi:hypothetical protein